MLLLIREQIVTPVDQRPQCLLARQRGAASAYQQAKEIIKARARDLFHGQHSCTSGGQLNRQRNAVQAVANLGDG